MSGGIRAALGELAELLPDAGKHFTRMASGRIFADFHPDAPRGMSLCGVCGRLVLRGEGRWWKTRFGNGILGERG